MSREDYVAIAIRLFAIYLAVVALRLIAAAAGAAALMQDAGFGFGLLIHAAVIVLVAAIALWFWNFPLTIARKLLPVMKEPRSEENAGPSVLVSVALTLMGVWLLAGAVIDGTYWLTLLVMTQQVGFEGHQFTHEQVANMLATVAELVLALVLLFGATGLRRLLFRIRYGAYAERLPD